MSKAAVVIGVDRTATLPVLRAGASSARRFATWADGQDFRVTLLTDEAGDEVTAGGVIREIAGVVAGGTCEQLVLYFSGHGILRAPDWEVWLLSQAGTNPNEAVNVSGSIQQARNCGIPHVIFVSDACRSLPDTPELGQVLGSILFPIRRPRPPRPDVDLFYATLPGDPALEIPVGKASATHDALFTRELLRGLVASDPTLIEARQEAGRVLHVVPSWKLKPFLEQGVPAAAAAVHVSLQQDPEVRVESHHPRYLSIVSPLGGDSGQVGPVPEPGSIPAVSGTSERMGRVLDGFAQELGGGAPTGAIGFGISSSHVALTMAEQAGYRPRMERLLAARGRESFETRTGFTVVGASVEHAEVPGGACDVFREQSEHGDNQVRVHDNLRGPESSAFLLLQLEGGMGVCLPVVPEFIGLVSVEDGRVVDVRYAPSRGTWRYDMYQRKRDTIEARHAFVAASAARGQFHIERRQARRYGESLRVQKGLDPTLGLYAAYAYARADRIEDIQSICNYVVQDGQPVFRDIAMLAGYFMGSSVREQWSSDGPGRPEFPLTVSPPVPMLTQGFALALGDTPAMSPIVREAGRHTIPGLWTTFRPEGMAQLLRGASSGDLR